MSDTGTDPSAVMLAFFDEFNDLFLLACNDEEDLISFVFDRMINLPGIVGL